MAHTLYEQSGYHFVIFTSSENWIVPKGVTKVDVSIISGGNKGLEGNITLGSYGGKHSAYGGYGGAGGNMITRYNYSVNGIIPVTIGGGSGNSSFGDVTAYCKSNDTPGCSARGVIQTSLTTPASYGSVYGASQGNNGMICPINNVAYAGGGGGGKVNTSDYAGDHNYVPGSSGSNGGGYGANNYNYNVYGEPNTGGGGGGGSTNLSRAYNGAINQYTYNGYEGGSGVVILRFNIKRNNILFFSHNI